MSCEPKSVINTQHQTPNKLKKKKKREKLSALSLAKSSVLFGLVSHKSCIHFLHPAKGGSGWVGLGPQSLEYSVLTSSDISLDHPRPMQS